jgi:hypothetical protein
MFERSAKEYAERERQRGRQPSPLHFRSYERDTYFERHRATPAPNLAKTVGRDTPPITAPSRVVLSTMYEPSYALIERRTPTVCLAKQVPRRGLSDLAKRTDVVCVAGFLCCSSFGLTDSGQVYDVDRGRRAIESRQTGDFDIDKVPGRKPPPPTAGQVRGCCFVFHACSWR